MDKIINTHIDSLEDLESELDRIIAQEISQIKIDDVIANPTIALTMAVDNIRRIFLDEYVDEAIKLGFDFGEAIKNKIDQDKTIKINDTSNPNLNDTSKNNKQD